MTSTKKIVIIQRRLTHYRVPFFERLRAEFQRRDLELVLAHGNASHGELGKNDGGVLDWALPLQTRYWLDGKICWQPFGSLLHEASAVVMTAENKLIYNWYVQALRRDVRVVLWGHGANLQGNPNSLRERFKRKTARLADWWLAYTDMSVRLIEQTGFPADRISVLENAVDTTELARLHRSVSKKDTDQLRQDLGISGQQLGIYIGSLYSEKRIGFMLESALRIRARVPGFELLIVGAGPDEHLIRNFCRQYGWAKYVGPRKGRDKAVMLSVARVMINPGLVGLGILDSFVCGVPLATTDCGLHSPEISYLHNNENGIVTDNSIAAFADTVANLLRDEPALAKLKNGCIGSAGRYTIENMANNFASAMEACLYKPMYR